MNNVPTWFRGGPPVFRTVPDIEELIPTVSTPGGSPFKLILVCDAGLEVGKAEALANRLLDAGLRGCISVGRSAELFHDILDEVIVHRLVEVHGHPDHWPESPSIDTHWLATLHLEKAVFDSYFVLADYEEESRCWPIFLAHIDSREAFDRLAAVAESPERALEGYID